MAYKQHFIEWFSGKQLPSYLTFTDTNGTNTGAMADEVDGGYKITTGASNNNAATISFNDKRPFNHEGAVAIWVQKGSRLTTSTIFSGFGGDDTLNINWSMGGIHAGGSSTHFSLYTKDTSTASATASSVALDTDYHAIQVEMKSASNELSIEGSLQTTKSNNLPTIDVQPLHFAQTWSGGAITANMKYLEAYNT